MTISQTMKLASSLLVTLLSLGAGAAFAHSDGKVTPGYLQDNNKHVVKNNYGLCWRTGSWTPSMAIAECDPDLVKAPPKPAEKKPDTVPAETLVPPDVGPEKPALRVTIQAETLFAFDKAVLREDGKKTLDDEVVTKMKEHPEVEVVLVSGYADRIGSAKYNLKLSERRANAVKSYLESQGIASNRIEAVGRGTADPVVDCKNIKGPANRHNKKLVACLQPNRRVVVEVKIQAPTK